MSPEAGATLPNWAQERAMRGGLPGLPLWAWHQPGQTAERPTRRGQWSIVWLKEKPAGSCVLGKKIGV